MVSLVCSRECSGKRDKKEKHQRKPFMMKVRMSGEPRMTSPTGNDRAQSEVTRPKVPLFSNCQPLCLLGSQVHVSKVSWTGNATEHGEAGFSCSLDGSSSTASSLYSVVWYRSRGTLGGSQMLAHLQYDGLLQYGPEGSRRPLHCYRSSPTDFVLKLHRVEMEDAGMYWCRVGEWQPHGHPGKWINQASDESQRMVLRVLRSGNLGGRSASGVGVMAYPVPLCDSC